MTFNYRVNAFGWLAEKGDLVGGAANVGLHDRKYHLDQHFLLLPAMVPRGSLDLNRHFGYLAEKLFLTWIQVYVHIFPSSVCDPNEITLCFFFPTGPSHIITSDRRHCSHHTAGSIVQDLSLSPPTSSRPPSIRHSMLPSSYAFVILNVF